MRIKKVLWLLSAFVGGLLMMTTELGLTGRVVGRGGPFPGIMPSIGLSLFVVSIVALVIENSGEEKEML